MRPLPPSEYSNRPGGREYNGPRRGAPTDDWEEMLSMMLQWRFSLPERLRGPGHRAAIAGGLLALATSALFLPQAVRAHPLRAQITVTGTVFDQAGKAVPGATVVINGSSATADASGHYSVQTTNKRHSLTIEWAPGFTEFVSSTDLSRVTGTVTLNFNGGYALSPAFVNGTYQATLTGLSVRIPSGTSRASFRMHTPFPVSTRFGVALPDGFVKMYRLRKAGKSYTGTFPLGANGAYRVEVLSAAATPIIDALIFRGVTPALPADPPLPADPHSTSTTTLAAYALQLINIARSAHHRGLLSSNPVLTRAAQTHTVDMVTHGYFLTHPHTGSDGSTPPQRVKRAGGGFSKVAEDVGSGSTVQIAFIEWLNSPLHLFNILGSYRQAGVGIVRSGGQVYLTVDFGR
jgi:uncharacterized protein YkwD